MPGNQLTLGSARLDTKPGAAVWLLEIERLQPQKSQIPDLFFFLTLHHRERFLEFMYFLMHIFKFLCLSCTHTHT